MFTGIVEEVGTVKELLQSGSQTKLHILAEKVLEGTGLGDSIAVNGVCLTVTNLTKQGFWADVMNETLRRSSLGQLRRDSKVNLERAMAADGRFGGHIVSGHIDGTGQIAQVKQEGNAVWYTICADAKILNGIVEKGSIAIDGISLTVADVDTDGFSVSVIPHTREHTVLAQKGKSDVVNLENDLIGKYVYRFLEQKETKSHSTIDETFLHTYGFL